jgi:hypothetical protein
MKYQFIYDAGHGWLRVPLKEIEALNIKPSSYSYRDQKFGYLEEDCDASMFWTAKAKQDGSVDVMGSVVRINGGDRAFVRNLARFEGVK